MLRVSNHFFKHSRTGAFIWSGGAGRNSHFSKGSHRYFSTYTDLQKQNKDFQQQLMGKYAMYVLSRGKKFSAAIKGLGSMEDASGTWRKECDRLYLYKIINVDMKSCVDYVHEVPGDFSEVERMIQTNAEAALLIVDMLIHEGKLERAKQVLQRTSHFNSLQLLHSKLYIGQIHFNEQRVHESRQVAFELLGNASARDSAALMRGALDILTVERPDDPPFYLDVKQMHEVLTNLHLVMVKHNLVCDFMRLIKRWAVPVWEQMNIDNQKNNKKHSAQQSNTNERFDGGNHLQVLLHPFILTFAKLEQVQSDLFETQFTLMRKDLLLSADHDSPSISLPIANETVASVIAHQTMFNQASWDETTQEKARVQQLQEELQAYFSQKGGNSQSDHTHIANDLLHLAMYRPLSHIAGFACIQTWDLSLFSVELREVIQVQVSEPLQQSKLVLGDAAEGFPGATVVSTISSQNANVGEFYTSHIYHK